MYLQRFRLIRPLLALPELWSVLFLVVAFRILQERVPPAFSASLGWTIHPYQVFAVCVALAWFMLPGILMTRILGIGGSWLTRLPTYIAVAVGVWTLPILWVASAEKYNAEYLMRLGVLLVAALAVIAYLRELWRPAHPDAMLDDGRTDLDEPLNVPLLILTVVVLVAAVYLSFIGPVALDDNLQVMYVQDDLVVPRINEFEPVFGVGIPPQTRGSLTTWPLSLTLMAYFTGLPAQQAFWLLRTPLVLLDLLAVYALSLRLFGRRNVALFSVVFYFLLTLIYTTDADAIGFALYARDAQDKFVARYTMFPMALAWSMAYLKERDKRAYWAAGFCTIGLSATHPIGIILLAIPLGGLGLTHLFNHVRLSKRAPSIRVADWIKVLARQNWPELRSLFLLSIWSLLGVILPLLQKASPDAPIVAYTLTDTRDPTLWFRIGLVLNSHRIYVADFLGPGAYIVHPSVFLEAYLILPALCLPLLFMWGRKRWEAEIIIGTFLLNPALLLIPPVVQFIGNRATPWLLYRFAWPMSLLGPLLIGWAIYSLLEYLRPKIPSKTLHSAMPVLVLAILAVSLNQEIKRGLTILNEQRTDSFSSRCRTLQPLFSKLPDLVGDGTVVLSTPDNNLCMVSSAAYAYPVEFGLTTTINRFPASRVGEAIQRMNDVIAFSFAEVVDQELMDILTRWKVGLILLRADHPLISQLQHMPQFFKLELTEDRYVVYRVLPGAGVDVHPEMPSKDRWKAVHWEGDDALVAANTAWSQERWEDAIAQYRSLVGKRGDSELLSLIGLGRANLSTGRLDEASLALETATQKYPETIESWILLGSTAMIRSDYPGMELAYGKALELMDWHPEALSRLADAYRFQGDVETAAVYYEQAVATDSTPGTSMYYRKLGSTYLKINWNDEAIAALTDSLEVRENLLAYSLLSQVYLNLNNTEKATEIASHARTLDYWSDTSDLILGKVSLHNLDYAGATEDFQRAIAKNPESLAIEGLASILRDVQSGDAALENVSDLIGYKLGFSEPVLTAARIQYSMGRLDAAIDLGERALEWKPMEARAADFLGSTQLVEGNWDRAHDYYMTALNLNPFDHAAYVGLTSLAQMAGQSGPAIGWGWASMVTSPYNADAWITVGSLSENHGDMDAALNNYQLATVVAPFSPQPFLTMGDFQLQMGEFDLATSSFNAALELQPDSTSAYRGLADVRQDLGDYANALQLANTAATLHPAEGVNRVDVADILIQSGDYRGAMDQLLQSIQLDPGHRQAYIRLGSLYTNFGMTSDAESLYMEMIQSMPSYQDGYLALGKLYELQGRNDKALSMYDSGLQQVSPYAFGNIILAKADLLRRQGEIDQSLELYQGVIICEPMLVNGYLALSEFHSSRGELDLARDVLEQGLDLLPTDPLLNTAYMQLLILQGKIDLAEETYQHLASIAPDPGLAVAHAQLTASMGKPELALEEIDDIRRHWPGNLEVLRSGVALAISAGQSVKAINMAIELIVLAPGHASSWTTLGDAYIAQGQLDRAGLAFRRATLVEPGNSSVYLALARFLDAHGETDQAIQALDEAIKRNHANPDPHLLLAAIWIRRGNTTVAVDELQTVIGLDASRNSALLAMGQINQKEGDLAEAQRYFSRAIRVSPLDSAAYQAQSQVYLLEGNTFAAHKSLLTATHMSPGDCRAFLNLANYLVAHGKYSDAHQVYGQTLERPGCQSSAHVGLGSLYQLEARQEKAAAEFLRAIDSEPANAMGYIAAAWNFSRQAKLDDAESTFKNGMATLPASMVLRVAYTRSLIQHGRFEEALSSAQYAVFAMPNSASYWILGETQEALGQYADAEKNFQTSGLMDRSTSVPILHLADLHAKLAQFDQAESEYRQAIELSPTDPRGYISLANMSFARGKTDEAIQVLDESLAVNQGQNNALIAQTRYYLRIGRYADATDVLQKSMDLRASDPLPFQDDTPYVMFDDMEVGSTALWNVMGDLYRAQSKWTEAEQAYKQAIAQVPGSSSSYVLLGGLYQALGRYPEAHQQFEQAIVIAPGFVSGHVALSDLLVQQANFDEAERSYQETLAASPGQADVLIHLGKMYMLQGRKADAREQFEMATRIAPTAPSSWVALGDWFYSQADVQRARQSYEHAIRVSPANPVGYVALGNYLENRGQRLDALAQYQEAVKMTPISKLSYFAIANWYQVQSDWVSAEEWYRRAIEVDAQNITALLGLGYIDLIQGRPREALENFQAAQAKKPASNHAYIALGDWYRLNINMEASRDAANAELTQARALAPQAERKQPPDEFIEYLFYEVKYMRNDEVEDAYANFEAAVAADPTSDLPYLAMGEGYRMSAGLLNAEQSYQAAIAAAPSDINGYLHLGKLYMMTNRRQEAYEQYERAAQVIPGSAVPHLYLAGWYRVQEDMPAAELEYQTAITMVPGEVRSYLRLAELYQSLDRENDVMEQYMNATQIGLPVEISICGPGRLPSSSVGIDTIEIFAANTLSSESWRCEWDQRPWSSMTVDEAN